jgi:hypothetical protein
MIVATALIALALLFVSRHAGSARDSQRSAYADCPPAVFATIVLPQVLLRELRRLITRASSRRGIIVVASSPEHPLNRRRDARQMARWGLA